LEISDLLHWFAPEAHNGMLEILLNVGFIGAAYIVFLWARTVFVAVRCMKISDQTVAISCLLSCAGILLVGISETVLIDPFEASTSLFFIVGFFCEKALRAPRLRPSWLNMPVANAAVGGRPFLTPRVELPRAGRRPSNRFR
jgi:O-antigen ligase